jgi:hypothetical protein
VRTASIRNRLTAFRVVILGVAKAYMIIELQMHAAMQAAMKQVMKYDFDQDIFKSAAS